MKPSFHEWATDRRLKGLVLLTLALASIALAGHAYYSFKSAKYINSYGPTAISVDGMGEVTRVPDVAAFTFVVHAEEVDVASAQEKVAEASNAIIVYLKENGVAESDIKTSGYDLSERYECPGDNFCPQERANLTGYSVGQTVEVKVRDTGKAGEFIAGIGQRGATNISGLTLIVDDDTDAKVEAQAKAVADAKEKAQQLADTLGVRLVRLTAFWEETGGYPMYEKSYVGDMMMTSEVPISPDVPTGENTITSSVNLTYEIR